MALRPYALVSLAPAALIGLASVFGGVWTWAALAYMTLGAWAMDRLVAAPDRDDNADPGERSCADSSAPAADRLSVALAIAHFSLLALVVGALASHRGGIATWVALFYTAGLFFGQVSNSNAHELIHRSDKRLFTLGKWIYISLLFGHHTSAHLKVHHRFAASADDPNSARRGESFFAFARRAWRGSFVKGYEAERADIRRRGSGGATPYVAYVLGGLGFLALAGLGFGTNGLAIYLALAGFAQAQLLLSDYVQHYGLARARKGDGRLEPIGPGHSWNGGHWFSAHLMLNAPRHSDHHAHPGRPYPELTLPPVGIAPRLPATLPVMALLALYPAGWRRVMGRALDAWERTKGQPA